MRMAMMARFERLDNRAGIAIRYPDKPRSNRMPT
jgi:hypothetical protein